MIYYMNSKTFQDIFLVNEKDKDILNAQYVIVSSRIRKKNSDNIITAINSLYPNNNVLSQMTKEDFRYAYFDQLDDEKGLIATLIKGSIEEKFNIIFICTKNEDKFKYLKYLSEYIYMEFDYPVYNYKQYAKGECALIKYDKDKVLKKCNKIVSKIKKDKLNKLLSNGKKNGNVKKLLKSMSKDELKAELKKRNLYKKGMDKSEMIDTLYTFL